MKEKQVIEIEDGPNGGYIFHVPKDLKSITIGVSVSGIPETRKTATLKLNKKYDEQVRVIDENGNPIIDLPYYIELGKKVIDYGRTNKDGLVKRLEKDFSKKEYKYYWGEEALYRIENLK